MSATGLVGWHGKIDFVFEIHESKLNSVKRFKELTVFSICFAPTLVDVLYVHEKQNFKFLPNNVSPFGRAFWQEFGHSHLKFMRS